MTVCNETVREIAETIIGNLDENGYLTVSLEEIAHNGNHSVEDVEEALATVQEFDPLGVGARNLRECLMIQLRMLDAQNALALQIVSECMPSGLWQLLRKNCRAPNHRWPNCCRAISLRKSPGL